MSPMIEHRDRGWCDCLTCTIPPPPKSETRRRALRRVRVRVLPVLTRGECATWTTPCRLTSCRYHLGETSSERCALNVADRGGVDGAIVAGLLGVSRQRANQIERDALASLARRPGVRSMADDLGRSGPSQSMRDRVLALLAERPMRSEELREALFDDEGTRTRDTLVRLRRDRIAVAPPVRGGAWRLVSEEES